MLRVCHPEFSGFGVNRGFSEDEHVTGAPRTARPAGTAARTLQARRRAPREPRQPRGQPRVPPRGVSDTRSNSPPTPHHAHPFTLTLNPEQPSVTLRLTIAELVCRGADPDAPEDPLCGLEKASSRLGCVGLCTRCAVGKGGDKGESERVGRSFGSEAGRVQSINFTVQLIYQNWWEKLFVPNSIGTNPQNEGCVIRAVRCHPAGYGLRGRGVRAPSLSSSPRLCARLLSRLSIPLAHLASLAFCFLALPYLSSSSKRRFDMFTRCQRECAPAHEHCRAASTAGEASVRCAAEHNNRALDERGRARAVLLRILTPSKTPPDFGQPLRWYRDVQKRCGGVECWCCKSTLQVKGKRHEVFRFP